MKNTGKNKQIVYKFHVKNKLIIYKKLHLKINESSVRINESCIKIKHEN